MSYALKSRRGTYQVTGKTWHLGSASLFYFCQSPASDLNVVTMEREVQGDRDVRNLRELICDLRFHFPKAALPTRSPSPLDKLELFIADPARASEAWEVLIGRVPDRPWSPRCKARVLTGSTAQLLDLQQSCRAVPTPAPNRTLPAPSGLPVESHHHTAIGGRPCHSLTVEKKNSYSFFFKQ